MNYWNWLLPVLGLLFLLICLALFVHLDSIQAAKNKARIKIQFNYIIKQNYAVVLIFLMLSLPVLLQLVYSVGPCIPVISAGDVLSFWGVVLGLTSGFYIWQIQKDKDRQDEMNRCKPVFSVSSCRNEDKEFIGIRVDSRCLVEFEIVKACGLDRKLRIQPFASEIVELSKQDIDKYQIEVSCSASDCPLGRGAPLWFEIVASDGTKWIFNFSPSKRSKYWTLCSTQYFSKA